MSNKQLRILFFTREDFPTHRVDVEVLFGKEIIGRGHTVDLVMQAATAATRGGRHGWHGCTALVGPTTDGRTLPARLWKNCLGLWHDLKCLSLASVRKYDAIQVRDKFIVAIVALTVARLRGLKFYYWLSFPFPEDDMLRATSGNSRSALLVYLRGRFSAWLLYRVILLRCDHAFVQSERMKTELCAHGVPERQLTPVPMGVDVSDISAKTPQPADLAAGRPTKIAYLGTLDANRGLGILVEMLAELRRDGIQAKLLLIGDSSEPQDRRALETLARRVGVMQHVEITGFLPRQEAMQRMRAADICVSPIDPSPIFRVGSPTKMIEYLAAGIPVVANDHPEQKLILRQCRAGVCVPWRARHFARAVRWLISLNPERRLAMAERGRVWVLENRTYGRIADGVEAKYRQLAEVR